MLLARVPGPQVYTDYIIIFPRVQFGNVQLKRYVTEMSKCAHCTQQPRSQDFSYEGASPMYPKLKLGGGRAVNRCE